MWRTNPGGIRELEMLVERGLLASAEAVMVQAKANIAPHRLTGALEDSIHVRTGKLDDWPKPVVFVATASGDGFYVHEGTVDTPYMPFLAMALDSVAREFPRLLRQSAQRGVARARPTKGPARPRSRRAAQQQLGEFLQSVRGGL